MKFDSCQRLPLLDIDQEKIRNHLMASGKSS